MNAPTLPTHARLIDTSYRALFDEAGIQGPVCHVGSLLNSKGANDKGVAKWRALMGELAPGGFVGIDLFPGPNVDVTADLCSSEFAQKHPDLLGQFGVVIASALLEHVADPFAAARNISLMIRSSGQLYYAGPWVWGYHAYPGDYWRISHSGLEKLFPDIEWTRRWYAGTNKNVGIELESPEYERKTFRLMQSQGIGALLSEECLPYLTVGAIGRKP